MKPVVITDQRTEESIDLILSNLGPGSLKQLGTKGEIQRAPSTCGTVGYQMPQPSKFRSPDCHRSSLVFHDLREVEQPHHGWMRIDLHKVGD